jgi:hypothetical protein
MMSYRGGDRLRRCLASIEAGADLFDRIILSVTAPANSLDEELVRDFAREKVPRAEVLWTGGELPTMQHQAFWVDDLDSTGVSSSEWIYWLAYDDQVFAPGIRAIVDEQGAWPLEGDTAYFGPWAMQHESADEVLPGDWNEPMDVWTSFPIDGPTELPVIEWMANQLRQPTYMQMSGSVWSFGSYLELRDGHPRKSGPMRIEMATALTSGNEFVAEFDQTVSVIYGRPDSDRASYGAAARSQDLHLAAWVARYSRGSLSRIALMTRESSALVAHRWALRRGCGEQRSEDWVVRGVVSP